jgi:hypothetical protein
MKARHQCSIDIFHPALMVCELTCFSSGFQVVHGTDEISCHLLIAGHQFQISVHLDFFV